MYQGENNPPDSPPITLSDLNLRRPPERVRSTICGKVRSYTEVTKLEWAYVVVTFIALAACFGLTIDRLVYFIKYKPDSSDFTFAILLLLTVVFCFYYVGHSVLTERGDELLVFVVSNSIVLIYCVLNYSLNESQGKIKLIRLIVVCTISPFLIGFGIYLSVRYFRSNNLIYNTVGGIADLQKACQWFFFCSSLLEFDLQLQLSMLILVMGRKGNALDIEQKAILASGVAVTVLFITLGYIGLRRESITLMIFFYILGLFEPAYVVYKFYYASKHEEDSETYESTFACGCFALVIWLLLMGCSWFYSTHFFGKGLKEKLHGYQSTPASNTTSVEAQSPGSAKGPP